MKRRTTWGIVLMFACLLMMAAAALSVDGSVCVDHGLGRTFVACMR